MVFSVKSVLTLLLFLTVTQNESGTRKAISWSVYKNISSQCNLTAQIEPELQNVVNFNNLVKITSLHLLIFFAWLLHLPLSDQAKKKKEVWRSTFYQHIGVYFCHCKTKLKNKKILLKFIKVKIYQLFIWITLISDLLF